MYYSFLFETFSVCEWEEPRDNSIKKKKKLKIFNT